MLGCSLDVTPDKTNAVLPGQANVSALMQACLDQNPLMRPTAASIYKRSTAMGLGARSVVELLLHRIQTHANVLEDEVALRTLELQEEMKKVDNLLKEMLPMYGSHLHVWEVLQLVFT